jgi:hypothetical protein
MEINLEFDIEKFNNEINKLCEDDDIPYIDAILIWCEDNNVEIEVIASIIKKNVETKTKIEEIARKNNLLKKGY